MKSPGNSTSNKSRTGGFSSLLSFIEARRYKEAEQFLCEAQLQAHEQGETALVSLLTAAYQICLACRQHHEEIGSHKRAYETAVAREHDLRLQLISLLKTVDETQSYISPKPGSAFFELSEGDDDADDQNISILEKARELWHKLKDRLPVEGSREQDSKRPKVETIDFDVSAHLDEETLPSDRAAYVLPARQSALEIPREMLSVRPVTVDATEDPGVITLVVYCLGVFQIYIDDKPILNWPNGKGKTIFKYLVTHREMPVAKEVLMELLWPEADPDAARNNLNVAIYGLRQTLRCVDPDRSHVIFRDDAYLLNPDMNIWVDMEEFLSLYSMAKMSERGGDLAQAIDQYRAAERLYHGEFMAEDRYDGWTISLRQHLQTAYLDLLERLSYYQSENADYPACIDTCLKMLTFDPCREEAHRLLMRCYYLQGQRYLSLRQYHHCVRSLSEELDVHPSRATINLYRQIRGRRPDQLK